MRGISHIACHDCRNFVTDFGIVAVPPKLRAELQRIDAHLEAQRARMREQWLAGAPLKMEDISDPA